jgi:heme/copper-type cytochrome/quinol oxidase subunit 2
MPIDTLLLVTFTLLTMSASLVAVLYTLIMHHVRIPARQANVARQHWLVDFTWACVPWLIVILLMYPALKKIFTHN